MTTICVVKKNGSVAMAGDTLGYWGENLAVPSDLHAERSSSKLITGKNLIVGMAGLSAHYLPLKKIFSSIDGKDLVDNDDVYDLSLGLHVKLKDRYFLNVEEEEYDAYESSQFRLVIATPKSIFCIESYRAVTEYSKFWAIGSGGDFALGALNAVYDDANRTAADIARIGVETGCRFDPGSSEPVEVLELK